MFLKLYLFLALLFIALCAVLFAGKTLRRVRLSLDSPLLAHILYQLHASHIAQVPRSHSYYNLYPATPLIYSRRLFSCTRKREGMRLEETATV